MFKLKGWKFYVEAANTPDEYTTKWKAVHKCGKEIEGNDFYEQGADFLIAVSTHVC